MHLYQINIPAVYFGTTGYIATSLTLFASYVQQHHLHELLPKMWGPEGTYMTIEIEIWLRKSDGHLRYIREQVPLDD